MKTEYLEHLSPLPLLPHDAALAWSAGLSNAARPNSEVLSSGTHGQRSTASYLPFGSLWDPNLLDRLTEPLTRYHE